MKALISYQIIILLSALLLLTDCRQESSLPDTSERYEDAGAWTTGNDLVVSTGLVERQWHWTGHGLSTVSFRNLVTGKEWCIPGSMHASDWLIPGLSSDSAKLISLRAEQGNDEGFTSNHLRVVAEIEYPSSGKQLRYEIWAYPGAPGLRTQISVKSNDSAGPPALYADNPAMQNDTEGLIETIPVNLERTSMTAWGYADGTQRFNSASTPIFREETEHSLPSEGENGWASGMIISDGPDQLIVVKESNKCFNTGFAANNGRFSWNETGLRNTGTGWLPEEMNSKEYRSCWAAWSILSNGKKEDARLALKQFDRFRYPVDPDRDIYMIANTWGSSVLRTNSRLAARESNILREIESAADLGIDIQQVDDGWQGNLYAGWEVYEAGRMRWRPVDSVIAPQDSPAVKEFGSISIPVYPEGWRNIREYAMRNNVKLGLWVYGNAIAVEDLIWNHQEGGFVVFKYDFFKMGTMSDAHRHLNKIRQFILATGNTIRTNWDVTGKPRIGYYLGRDQGAIYLENRKPESPDIVIYKPYLVLRDAWHISRYVNLNKFEITVQNPDRVTRKPDAYDEVSDAWKHPHDYCFAQTMMGTPIFFQETQLYTSEARRQLKPLIRIYKEHREELYAGYPFTIGSEPDNRSWSGFQNFNPVNDVSYLTIFRQIQNNEQKKELKILFYEPGSRLRLTDLVKKEMKEVILGPENQLEFEITDAPGYLFLKLEKIIQ